MFDFSYTPALVVKHLVVQDTFDSQFRIFLDGVIFQVFIASVSVDQIGPAWILGPDAAVKQQSHGRTLHIQRLVILNRL